MFQRNWFAIAPERVGCGTAVTKVEMEQTTGSRRRQKRERSMPTISSRAILADVSVPHGASTFQPRETADPALSFLTPEEGSGAAQPLFATRIDATPARITGVGFFDRFHHQTGAAPNVLELHPVLRVEWM